MTKSSSKLSEKDLTTRLSAVLLTALKRDAGEHFKARVNRAIATWPENAGLAAVRLVQLCGRVPNDALVAEILGAVPPVKDSVNQGSGSNSSLGTLPTPP